MKLALYTRRLQHKPFGEQIFLENFFKALTRTLPVDWQADVCALGVRAQREHLERMDRIDPNGRLQRRRIAVPYSFVRGCVAELGIGDSRLLFGNADLVHALTVAWMPRCNNFAMTIQDMLILRSELGEADEKTRLEFRRCARHLLSFARVVITISEFSKREIVELLQVDPQKIVVIADGVDAGLFHPPSAQEREIAPELLQRLNLQSPYFLHMGGCAPRKNVGRLIQAFDLFKQRYKLPHKLVLSGSGATSVVSEQLAGCSHRADIVFTGYLPETELVLLLQAADALVFPSTYEGFGLPPLEAMACGVPAAIANAASLPEVGGDAAVYFDPLCLESMAETMYRIVTDSALRQQCFERGIARSRLLTWDRNAEQTIEVYRALSNRPSALSLP